MSARAAIPLRALEADFEAALAEYLRALRAMRRAAEFLCKRPQSKRRLDAVLRARIRETAARRKYQAASRALFTAIMRGMNPQ